MDEKGFDVEHASDCTQKEETGSGFFKCFEDFHQGPGILGACLHSLQLLTLCISTDKKMSPSNVHTEMFYLLIVDLTRPTVLFCHVRRFPQKALLVE